MELNNENYEDMMNCSLTTGDGTFYIDNNTTNNTGSGITTTGTCYPIYNYYWDWYYPCNVHYERSKVDIAFRIMKVLGDKKLINMDKLTVGTFISLVNDLAKEL